MSEQDGTEIGHSGQPSSIHGSCEEVAQMIEDGVVNCDRAELRTAYGTLNISVEDGNLRIEVADDD